MKRGTTLTRTTSEYDKDAIGVISTAPGITLGAETGATPVALAGRVPVTIDPASPSIEPGDMITTSAAPGKGMKATKAGMVVGTALESWTSDDPDGQVLVFVNRGFYDPGLYITDTGDVSIIAETSTEPTVEKYGVKKGSETIERKGLFSDLFSGTITAGSIEATKITVNGQNLMDLIQGRSSNGIATPSAPSIGGQAHDSDFSVISNEVRDLRDRNASLSARFATLESLVGSTNDLLAQLTTSPVLGASSSATQQSVLSNQEIGGDLSVLGRTTLSELGVTGNITAGLLTINGLDATCQDASSPTQHESGSGQRNTCTGASINTVGGPLQLQSQGIEGIDIMNGKVTVATNGDITTKGEITVKKVNVDESDTFSKSIGEVMIPAGKTYVDVTTTALTSSSRVFVTPERPTSIGAKKRNATTFRIEAENAVSNELKVNWWIVN